MDPKNENVATFKDDEFQDMIQTGESSMEFWKNEEDEVWDELLGVL